MCAGEISLAVTVQAVIWEYAGWIGKLTDCHSSEHTSRSWLVSPGTSPQASTHWSGVSVLVQAGHLNLTSCVSEVLVLGPVSAGLTYWPLFWDWSWTWDAGNLVFSPVSSQSPFILAWASWLGPGSSITLSGTTEGGCAYHHPGPSRVLCPVGEDTAYAGATLGSQLISLTEAAPDASSHEQWQQVLNKCMSLQSGRDGARLS